MSTVYIETTIISYLAAWPSRDLVRAAHQQITQEWWDKRRTAYNLLISEVVLKEIQAGDPQAAQDRVQRVRDIRLLGFTDDVTTLALIYQAELKLPPKAGNDILHISFAVSYNVDYLLTWNCSHIANGATIKRLVEINQKLARSTPVIVTPEELLEE